MTSLDIGPPGESGAHARDTAKGTTGTNGAGFGQPVGRVPDDPSRNRVLSFESRTRRSACSLSLGAVLISRRLKLDDFDRRGLDGPKTATKVKLGIAKLRLKPRAGDHPPRLFAERT